MHGDDPPRGGRRPRPERHVREFEDEVKEMF